VIAAASGRVRVGVVAALVAGISAMGLVSPVSAAVPTPRIGDAHAFDAPQGDRGGIETPYVYCSTYRAEPRVRVDFESLRTGRTHTYQWTGSLPNMGFPRVEVGRYRVTTAATCRGTTRTREQNVTVREKAPRTTVSRAEWRRIKRGMTVERVRRIVGYAGESMPGSTGRIYDMMPFWRWSVVDYRNGRVVSKMWNVGHD
jgi:hypothetical protein